MASKVAVYGSLRKGMHNHYLLGNSKFLGKAKGSGLVMYSMGGFPAVVPSGNDHETIVVELYEVSPQVLEILDRLEGYPEWYNRKVHTFITEEGTKEEAQIYFMSRFIDRPVVPGGDWVRYYTHR